MSLLNKTLRPEGLGANNLVPNVFPSLVFTFTTDRQIDFAYPKDGSLFSPKAREALEAVLPVALNRLVNIHQVHTDNIVVADSSSVKNRYEDLTDADAIITNEKNLAIAVRTADCLSVFLYDEKHRAIGVVHAGWKSTQLEITAKTVLKMNKEFGTEAKDLQVILGPCARRESYEVGEEFCKYFPYETIHVNGKWYFDVAQANRRQLQEVGVKDSQITDVEVCTMTDKRCFSHRKEAEKAGRMLSVIMIKE